MSGHNLNNLKKKQLVIIGDSAFAEVAYEYFLHDSDYQIVGFSVETKYLNKKELFGLPIIPFEQIEKYFSFIDVSFYVAIVYTQLNRLRTRLYHEAKMKGYKPASYISSKATISKSVEIGEHCFIFENNVLQPFAQIQNNVVLWSGNHIGHHTTVKDNCFISSHVVVSGFCSIEKNCFLGVNSCIGNNIIIAEDNWIGPGVTINSNTSTNQLFTCPEPILSNVSTQRFFKFTK